MQPNDKALYVILKSPRTGQKVGAQLALHVQLRAGRDDEIMCFFDTERGHMIHGEITSIHDHGFTFQDIENFTWELREVTIQEFRHRLAKTVGHGVEIAKTLKTTDDLWAWYRRAFPI